MTNRDWINGLNEYMLLFTSLSPGYSQLADPFDPENSSDGRSAYRNRLGSRIEPSGWLNDEGAGHPHRV